MADAVKRVLTRVENYRFNIGLLLADSGLYNERVIRRAREIQNTGTRPIELLHDRVSSSLPVLLYEGTLQFK